MQLSNIKRTTVGKNVLVDENTIVIYVPSVSQKVWDGVYNSGFLLNNCRGIIVPNKIIKFNKRPFNGRIHYLETKKQFIEKKDIIKKIPVMGSFNLVNKKEENVDIEKQQKIKQFYFYDLSMVQNAVSFFQNKLADRKIFQFFFDELKSLYSEIKKENPEKQIILVFDIKNKNDLFYNFFLNFRQIRNQLFGILDGERFFEKFVFVSTNSLLIPVLEYDKKELIQPIFPMINKIEDLMSSSELADEINGTNIINTEKEVEENPNLDVPNKSIFTKIVDTLADPSSILNKDERSNFVDANTKAIATSKPVEIKTTVNDDNTIAIDLDNKALSKIMKYFKITNADIIANTKAAIDNYIKETGTVPTKENAEQLVLKAVSKSIHGTDEIDPIYVASPNLLFEKLKDVNVFSVPLNFPKDESSFPFKFEDIITLKSVTGQHRQKFEFTQSIHENIEKVFKILEEQKHPIKVNKIDYKYVDNNLDRYTEYKIDLENLDGNKQKYTVHLNVPAVINDKYFKIGGNK